MTSFMGKRIFPRERAGGKNSRGGLQGGEVKKPRKKKLFIALGLCAFVLLLFAGTAEYTSHSKFCSVCHYMKPFYQSWQESAHSGIECSECHYPPGLLL